MSARTRASALEALGYAKGTPPLDLEDRAFRELVVWLEDTKIRATPMDARGPLRAIDSGDWPSAFAALARETSCPADATNPKETARAFDHLLSSAVALDYRDDADALQLVDMCSGNPAMLRSVAAFCKKRQVQSRSRFRRLPQSFHLIQWHIFNIFIIFFRFLFNISKALLKL